MNADPARAWQDLCERLRRLGSEVAADPRAAVDPGRAEGFRHLTRLLTCALQQVIEFSDVERPVFYANPTSCTKWGGENPDNLYLHATIDGSATYRIRGQRGSVLDFIVQTSSCGPMEAAGTGARKNRPTAIFGELEGSALELDADGRFEITVSRHPHPGNWLPSHPDAGFVLIRQYFGDWERERSASFSIERVEGERLPAPPPSSAQLAEMLGDAVAWVEHGLSFWRRYVEAEHARTGPNALAGVGHVEGGVQRILYGQGSWDLQPDQALLVEFEAPKARYWQISLLSEWFETLDYATRQSSLNHMQAQLDPDGRVRAVISQRDPGVPNWLDTAGHPRGMIQYRWVWSSNDPSPVCRVVPLAQLGDHLPASTPAVSAAQRQATLRARRAHLARRERGA
jgi:hypothetical protein